MHLNGIAKRITALALGAALLTATALPAFAEGTQRVTYTAGNYTFEKISHPHQGHHVGRRHRGLSSATVR